MAESLQEMLKRTIVAECDKRDLCDECPFATCEGVCIAGVFASDYVDKQSKKLKEWAARPIKTYKDVFFEKFPKAIKRSDCPPTCRNDIFDGGRTCGMKQTDGVLPDCAACWNEEYKEDNDG